jgi:Gluconate 2-dehydrogenase subunit 3
MSGRHRGSSPTAAGPSGPGAAPDGPRFPGFDVLDQVGTWDSVTAATVLRRLTPTDGLRFFTPAEAAVARPLLDLLVGQDGQAPVPVLDLVDARLAAGWTDGWRYDDLPEDAVAWRATLSALDTDARLRFGRGFGSCRTVQQMARIQAVQDAGSQPWHGWPADRVWSLWTRYACTAFYSHPQAWNEIGFGGPAYPRGYKNRGLDRREPWEVADARPTLPDHRPSTVRSSGGQPGPDDTPSGSTP